MSGFVARWFPRSTARKTLLAAASELWLAPEAVVNDAFAQVADGATRLQNAADVRTAIDLVAAERAEAAESGPGYEVVDGVAVIPLFGMLMQEVPSAFDFFGIAATSLRDAHQVLGRAVEDSSAQAILLAINSPGGTLPGTSDFADAVTAANKTKPVHSYAMDQAASAAYWIGAQAERFTAGKTSSVGSIGVYTSVADTSQQALQRGVVVHHIASGPEKGAGSTEGAPVTDAHQKSIQDRVDRAAELFGDAVMTGRALTKEQVKAVSSGRSWFGVDAVGLGLVDAVGTLDSALEEARTAAFSRDHSPSVGAQHPAPTGVTEGTMSKTDTPVASATEDLRAANVQLNAEVEQLKEQLQAREQSTAAIEAKVDALTASLAGVKADAMCAVLDRHTGNKFKAADRPAWEARAAKMFDGDAKGMDAFLADLPDILHTEARGHDGKGTEAKASNKPDRYGLSAADYQLADNVVAISAVTGKAQTQDGDEIDLRKETN